MVHTAGIPSESATPTAVYTTSTEETTVVPQVTTLTSVMTSIINEVPSTVIAIITTTLLSPAAPTTQTSIQTVTGGGNAPYRPTLTSTDLSATESYCPAGYYGCLAVHGGGCCRTDRDCNIYDCPSTARTNVVTGMVTVAVPVTDVPDSQATATCLGGWYLCGDEAGPVAGCCPIGFVCGTASCVTSDATATQTVQKELPTDGAGGLVGGSPGWICVFVALLAF